MVKKINNNYGDDDIQTLKGLMAVRFRPTMYIGDTGHFKSQYQIIKEATDNCFDEATKMINKQHTINISFLQHGKKYQVIITDTGRGVPLGMIEPIFTTLHTSGKWSKAYGASSGTNGVGIKATAALSTKFCAVSKRPEGSAIINIKNGELIRVEQAKQIDTNEETNGTTMLIEPDPTMFHGVNSFIDGPGFKMLINLMELLSVFIRNVSVNIYLNKGYVTEKELLKDPTEVWKSLRSLCSGNTVFISDPKLTVMDYMKLRYKVTTPPVWQLLDLKKPLNMEDDTDPIGYDIQMFCTASVSAVKTMQIITTVNNTPMDDHNSHHVSGLVLTLKEVLLPYIVNTEMHSFFNQIYKLPIYTAIQCQFKGAVFINQTKDEFKERVFLKLYTDHLRKKLKQYPDNTWERLYDLLENDIQEKYNLYTNKSIKSSKGLKDIAMRLADSNCYTPCRSNDSSITELFITEGDSAGVVVGTKRNKDYQAVYKLRGKFLNVLKSTDEKIDNSVLYNDLVKVLGVGPYDKDLSSLNFHSIFILADADADGYHIVTLTIGNLFNINPLLLSEGKVYVSNPPLYVLSAKDKSIFLRDNNALIDAKVTMLYIRIFDIFLKFNSQPEPIHLTGVDFKDFCYIVERIGGLIEEVANSLNVDPFILEQLIHCVDYIDFFKVDTEKIREILGLSAVVHHTASNSLILAVGGIEISVALANLKEEICAYILPELEKIHWTEFDILIDTKHTPTYRKTPMSFMHIYHLFKTVDDRNPSGAKLFTVSRFKGLGEMTPEQVGYTCLNPASRSYTSIIGVGDVDKLYNMLGKDSQYRKKLLLANA